MDKEIIRTQLQILLETIQEQFSIIKTSTEHIPQIEYDILRENLRKFYDQLCLLQRLNDPYEPLGKKKPEIKAMLRPKESGRKEEQPEKKLPKPSDIDLFAEEEPSFNIKLKEAREKSLPQKPNPVKHLKNLISINDKFNFINELFDGNLREYNQAIETLNGFPNRKEALDYLDLLRKKNLWELGSGTLLKLKELLEKKF